ncbi:MFS transporter [Kitasatospora sp. RB6PN24]|uniref:MFS transporter n=1 Tax=Kitasatospora humi TaxID=2893891 RepID=UPI001E382DD7|nr:MFS transporter [Kitasatospora humi]MCC9309823.1 MFS transporter [Kitasatospora humi]
MTSVMSETAAVPDEPGNDGEPVRGGEALSSGPVRRVGYREVLARPVFRLLWWTGALGVAMDTLRMATISVLVYSGTRSPLLGGLAFGAGFAPQLVGSLLLGSLADRGRPRLLITAGQLLSACAAAVPAFVRLPVGAALVLVAVVAALAPVSSAAGSRLVAAELTGDAYVVGRSLNTMATAGAQLLGLACAGAVVGGIGPRGALLVSGGGYLFAALAVRLRLPNTAGGRSQTAGERTALVRSSWGGARALLAAPRTRIVLLAQWLPPAFAAGAEGLIVPYIGQCGLPFGDAGLLLGALATGMIIGDLIVGRWLRPASRERLVAPLTALLGLPLTAFWLRPGPATAVVLLLVAGLGFAYGLGLQRPFLAAVPAECQGQAFGLLAAGMMTIQGVGPVLFGAVAQLGSAAGAMSCAGFALLVTAGWQARITQLPPSARGLKGE